MGGQNVTAIRYWNITGTVASITPRQSSMRELEIPIIKHFRETKQHKQKQKQKQSHSRENEHIFWETIRKNNIGIQF